MEFRASLFKEDSPSIDGRVILSPHWNSGESYPLTIGSTNELIGKVHSLRREDDGWITGIMEITGLAAESAFIGGNITSQDNLFFLSNAELKYVKLGKTPAWEGMTLNHGLGPEATTTEDS